MIKRFSAFFVPAILWMISFHHFYSGKIVLYADASRNFIYTNYFFNHLKRGIFPLWNPFYAWGRPDYYGQRQTGELNPFLYVSLILNQIGMSFALSYFVYLISYFFFGVWGFYLLSKSLLKEKSAVYLSTWLFMFSSFGSNLFNDIHIMNIVIPTIWFFYFWIEFSKQLKPRFFLGLIFSMMILAVTFIPFYFLCVWMIFLLLCGLIYPRDMHKHLRHYFNFCLKHKWLTVLGIFSMGISLYPAWQIYADAQQGNFFCSWRGDENGSQLADLSLKTISLSSLAGPFSLTGLFSFLDNLRAGSIYVPIFAYIVLLFGVFVPLTRRLILLFLAGTIILLISLGDVTPLHQWLYDHLFFMRKFRNLHFLFWLAVPFLVLFAAEQFQYLNSALDKCSKKWAAVVMLVHVMAVIFLLEQDRPLISSYVAVILSGVYFTLRILRFLSNKNVELIVLMLVVLQPLQVFYYLGKSSKGQVLHYSGNPYSFKESFPRFACQRPAQEAFVNRQKIMDFGGDIQDNSGFVVEEFIGSPRVYSLQKNIKHEILQDYVVNKFIVYDQVEYDPDQQSVLNKIEPYFKQKKNMALVDLNEFVRPVLAVQDDQYRTIKNEDKDFKVSFFDVNALTIHTDFSNDKFIVYNDSFHPGWTLKIDGVKQKISRTNAAFKGWWVQAGKHTIELRYQSRSSEILSWFLLIYFCLYLGMLICIFGKNYPKFCTHT